MTTQLFSHHKIAFFKEEIDPRVGLQGFQARKIAFNLGLSGEAFKNMTKFVASLYKAYDGIDSAMFEINPVLKTSDDKIIAVATKDPTVNHTKDISELPSHFFAVLKNYFEQYKVLENKVVLIDEIQDKETAYGIINDSIVRYNKKFPAQ